MGIGSRLQEKKLIPEFPERVDPLIMLKMLVPGKFFPGNRVLGIQVEDSWSSEDFVRA
jgi:hypothetical protein